MFTKYENKKVVLCLCGSFLWLPTRCHLNHSKIFFRLYKKCNLLLVSNHALEPRVSGDSCLPQGILGTVHGFEGGQDLMPALAVNCHHSIARDLWFGSGVNFSTVQYTSCLLTTVVSCTRAKLTWCDQPTCHCSLGLCGPEYTVYGSKYEKGLV